MLPIPPELRATTPKDVRWWAAPLDASGYGPEDDDDDIDEDDQS